MLARRGLSSAIAGLLRPKTSRWLKIEPTDAQIAEDDEVKAWLEDSEERLFRAIYAPEARFIKATHEVDDDLVTFGSGCLFVGEGRDLNRLLFRSFHLKDCFPAENEEGAIDTMHVVMLLTARQAAQRYGEEERRPINRATTPVSPAVFSFMPVKPRSLGDQPLRGTPQA